MGFSPSEAEAYSFYSIVAVVLPGLLLILSPSITINYNNKSSTFTMEFLVIMLFIVLPILLPAVIKAMVSKIQREESAITWEMNAASHKLSILFIRVLILNISANYFLLFLSEDTGNVSSASEYITFASLLIFVVISFKQNGSESVEPTTEHHFNTDYITNLVREIYPHMRIRIINSESKFAYFKFLNRNTIFVSRGMLRSSHSELQRVIYHELGHKEQGIRVIAASLFLLGYFLVLGELIAYLPLVDFLSLGSLRNQVINYSISVEIVYFLVLPVPYFVARTLNWNMEIDAEFRSALRLGKEKYYKAVGSTMNFLRAWRLKGKTVFGMGIEKYYSFYPPPYVQVDEVVKRLRGQ